MKREYLNKYLCTYLYSLVKAMMKINENSKGILFVIDSEGKLKGSVTDGDIRRSIISGASLETNIGEVMNRTPLFIYNTSKTDAVKIMRMNSITALPILDTTGAIFDIAFLNEEISNKKPVFVIAEAGVNHNGDFNLACKLADAAKEAGADCVKFQTFNSENLTSKFAQKAEYQKNTTGESESQQDLLKKLELTHDEFRKLKDYCDSIGICFASTPFDTDSLRFLETIDMPFWKIPSGEVTNLPILAEIGKTRKPVILSTGMSNMDEVDAALKVLKDNGATEISLLHCTTEYPTPLEDVNLKAMESLRNHCNLEVGYSDHTIGIEVPIAAVAMGATIIEKHFTLDKNMEGPDHKASLEPDELKRMISCIRDIEVVLGDGNKIASSSEIKNMPIARKSIVAKCNIKKGDILTEDNITTKRPGNGISPMRWNDVIGTAASRDFFADELID